MQDAARHDDDVAPSVVQEGTSAARAAHGIDRVGVPATAVAVVVAAVGLAVAVVGSAGVADVGVGVAVGAGLVAAVGLVARATAGARHAGPSGARRAHELAYVEVVRARRAERPLAVLVVRAHGDGRRVGRTRRRAALARGTVDAIERELRRSDVVWSDHPGGATVVVAPDTDARGAAALAERLCAALPAGAHGTVTVGVARFPEEAITLDRLVAMASDRGVGSTAPAATLPGTAPAGPPGAPVPTVVSNGLVVPTSIRRPDPAPPSVAASSSAASSAATSTDVDVA